MAIDGSGMKMSDTERILSKENLTARTTYEHCVAWKRKLDLIFGFGAMALAFVVYFATMSSGDSWCSAPKIVTTSYDSASYSSQW